MLPLVDALAAGTRSARQEYADYADANPEVEPADHERIDGAFDRFLADLDRLRAALGEGRAEDAEAAARSLEETAAVLRTARERGPARLASPTPYGYVNRILIHVEALRGDGAATRFARMAVADLPLFVESMVRDAKERDARWHEPEALATAEQAVRRIADAVQAFAGMLDGEVDAARLDAVAADLKAGADALRNAAAAYLQNQLAGPTQIPVVNLVLQTSERLQKGEIEADELRQVLTGARTALDDLVAQTRAVDLLNAGPRLQSALERMQEAAGRDPLGLRMETAYLRDAASDLASCLLGAAAPSTEEEDLLNFVQADGAPGALQGMPENFQIMLGWAAAFLQGGATAEELAAALDSLQRVVDRARVAPDVPEHAVELLASYQQGMGLVEQALESLRALPAHRDPRVVDAARSLFGQAADILQEVADAPV